MGLASPLVVLWSRHHMPVDGGTDSVIGTPAQPASNLALDRDNLYFAGTDGGLYRQARAGGAATKLASGAAQTVAVDDACVYWNDSAANALFTLAK